MRAFVALALIAAVSAVTTMTLDTDASWTAWKLKYNKNYLTAVRFCPDLDTRLVVLLFSHKLFIFRQPFFLSLLFKRSSLSNKLPFYFYFFPYLKG